MTIKNCAPIITCGSIDFFFVLADHNYYFSSLLQNEEDQVHYPSMCSYSTSDVFVDLIEFAAKHLVIGGHLVYWLPVIKEE